MNKEIETELPVRSFASVAAFEKWLQTNHARSPGIWLRFFKKSSARKALTHAGALDVALCYGWIDGQLKKHDDISYLHKFTPRGAKSAWSKVNRERVERLRKEGRMQLAGLAAVAAAKKDGRWDSAYDPQNKMEIPEDFLRALAKNQKAADILRYAQSSEPLLDRVAATNGEEARDGRQESMRLSSCSAEKRSSTNGDWWHLETYAQQKFRYRGANIG